MKQFIDLSNAVAEKCNTKADIYENSAIIQCGNGRVISLCYWPWNHHVNIIYMTEEVFSQMCDDAKRVNTNLELPIFAYVYGYGYEEEEIDIQYVRARSFYDWEIDEDEKDEIKPYARCYKIDHAGNPEQDILYLIRQRCDNETVAVFTDFFKAYEVLIKENNDDLCLVPIEANNMMGLIPAYDTNK
jgi:predicted Ser/Thr protein kinase